MNAMQHESYQAQLENMAADMRRSLRQRGRIEVERAPDGLDDTLLAVERESATYELERLSSRIRQIERALARIRLGTYGICATCEDEIPEKRLKAVPWAIYCLECQETVDRMHAQVNDFEKARSMDLIERSMARGLRHTQPVHLAAEEF